ncbi:MAG: ribonucleoside triphosphate reductase [Planctomycetia bacterium]|nr:ribonucleoside triphosphate reductase [Planctomycetia bacterium]
MKQIVKRCGDVVPFTSERIEKALSKALRSSRYPNDQIEIQAREITQEVCDMIEEGFFAEGKTPGVEDVQDLVEKCLIKRNLPETAKAYILYREQHRKIRSAKHLMMDIQSLVSDYIHQTDWRVNENSNADYSYASLLNHISGAVVANYTLANIYPKEIAEGHANGDFHLHDLSCGIVGYCAGWSLSELLLLGFQGSGGRASAAPAKHFDTALGQIVNFLSTLQTEWAGAQAFSSFDTLLAPFVRADGLNYRQVKQNIQQLIFGLNIASRWGQTPFTNLTFDWEVPEDLRDTPVVVGGVAHDSLTYKDFKPEMDMINRAFLEVMAQGDRDGRIFTFPIPTYNITKDFDWDSENARLLFSVTGRYGLPYFQNFVNSSLKPGDVRSMCCRLQMDIRELRNKTGGLFGAGEKTGSIGVVTINLPRLGYFSQTEDELMDRLFEQMDLAKESLEIKRKVVQNHLESDLLPYTKTYLQTLEHHFSTIGLVGMNECCLNLLGCNIAEGPGQAFAHRILRKMTLRLQDYQEETGHIYNLEATPAEGASFRLAKIDKAKYPDIITAGGSTPYYTNSSQLPVSYTSDLFEALELQDHLQCLYTGGTVFHAFLGERIEDPSVTAALVKKIATRFKLPYFTLTPSFSICPVHGYIPGAHAECPCER